MISETHASDGRGAEIEMEDVVRDDGWVFVRCCKKKCRKWRRITELQYAALVEEHGAITNWACFEMESRCTKVELHHPPVYDDKKIVNWTIRAFDRTPVSSDREVFGQVIPGNVSDFLEEMVGSGKPEDGETWILHWGAMRSRTVRCLSIRSIVYSMIHHWLHWTARRQGVTSAGLLRSTFMER